MASHGFQLKAISPRPSLARKIARNQRWSEIRSVRWDSFVVSDEVVTARTTPMVA